MLSKAMSDDEIFCAALELENEDQQISLIQSLCASDSEQLARVSRLLETHRSLRESDEDSHSILDRPEVVFQIFASTEELLPGVQVGKYVLREQIGEGATSLVFRAHRQSPVEGDVALKILKPGMDSQRILARFGLEHQLVKLLEHPGIAPVLDAGVHENGRPFFAMELVPNALTIVAYADRYHLDVRQRLQLSIAACEIVQHAHQRGVIHRDLKPSNILIEGVQRANPMPRIIDFGIAKILQPSDDSSSFTTHGDRFGTPAYMSPEQALLSASSLDIRSDVYSLGVILYELLTGATPRQASNCAENNLSWTNEAFWQYETKAPSQILKREVKPLDQASMRELDWVVLKAITKDKHDRYQTVADLQRDLQRFLDGEPVEAAGASFLYKAKKLIARNKAVSYAAALSLITIVGTSILTASYAFRAHNAEQRVRNQLQETLIAQKELVQERDRAEAAMLQSQSLLRVFQVQTATDHSLARYVKNLLDQAQRGQFGGQSLSSQTIQIQVEVLTKPHDRLIVQGDWTWASSRFPTEIINASFEISSREAAQAVSNPEREATPGQQPSLDQSQPSPTSLSSNAAQERDSLQRILLEELQKILPNDDPFIAEVCDNCGLQALDRNDLTVASQYLSESVQKWGKTAKFTANLAQSQLFLAEALLRQSQHEQAASVLSEARDSLDRVQPDSQHLAKLMEFYDQLRTQSQNVK